jgi:hypothetical protein
MPVVGLPRWAVKIYHYQQEDSFINVVPIRLFKFLRLAIAERKVDPQVYYE